MTIELTEKVIIVTGGASGIGRSIALSLASEKAIVCIIDHNGQAFPDISNEMEEAGGKAFCLQAELTNRDACLNAVNQVFEKFERIDGLVNNAGLNDGVSLENGDIKKFMESFDKNVGHYHTMSEFCLPHLKKSKGVIVNICSKTGETGQGGTSGYAAANGARLALTENWAAKFPSTGIRVNAVVVAECWTPQYKWWISQQANPEEKLKEIASKIPLENRMTTCEEIADTVLFLLSPKSSGINGQLMHVDGGYVHLDRAVAL
jgi:L-fucose dehydrogenase